MVTYCKLCKLPYTSDFRRRKRISFHSIPKDPKVRQQWFQIIAAETGREIEGNPAYMKVCSQHFEASCFKTTSGLNVLKPNSIPTLKRVYSDGLVLTSTSPTSNTTPMVEMRDVTNLETDETVAINADEISEDTDNVAELQRLLSQMTKEIDDQRREMKMYHQRYVRSQKKALELKNQIWSARENKDLPKNVSSHNAAHDEFVYKYFKKIEQQLSWETTGEDFKEFSLQLHKISPEAYHYIRERFLLCLPHTRSLTRYRAQARKLS